MAKKPTHPTTPEPQPKPHPEEKQLEETPADDVFSMPLEKLQQNVTQAMALIKQAEDLLPGLILLTDDDRRHTNGHYRDGEADALQPLTALAAKKPALFESLADEDEGNDPTRFEPELIGDRIARVIALAPIVTEVGALSLKISDSALHLGEQTRSVLLSMYDIAKPPARRDSTVMTYVATAMSFYAKTAALAAATRKKNKAAGK